jgi:hypothetical protein
MFRTEVDWPMENRESIIDNLETMGRYKVAFRMLIKIGPAGGNPLVELSGERSDVRKYLTEVYMPGEENEAEIDEIYMSTEKES